MRVYRYLSEPELNNMISGKTSELGQDGTFIKIAQRKYKTKLNTHRYVSGEKYLHFFKSLSDIEYIRQERRDYTGNFYFAEFEIPPLVLFFAAGKGFYSSLHGYDCFTESVSEFAVKSKNFNPDWLVGYTLDHDKKHFMNESEYSKLDFSNHALEI